jgi:hypothetical protein
MSEIQVFDPALCCSSGVCGPEVDETLLRFAADVEWLKGRGVAVRRHNLAHDGSAFVATRAVREALAGEGTASLPLVLVEGRIVSRGAYPDRAELVRLAGTAPSTDARPPRPAPGGGLPVQACEPGTGCC